MGNDFSTTAAGRFVLEFSTAAVQTDDDVARGVQLLDVFFSQGIAIAPLDGGAVLEPSVTERLFFNAVDNNRLGIVMEYARRLLDRTTSNRSAVSSSDLTAAAVRFAQCILTLAMRRCEGGVFLLKKLVDVNGEASALHTAAVDFIVTGIPLRSAADLRLRAEVLLLLLTFYSSALYHPAIAELGGAEHPTTIDPHGDFFLDAVSLSTDPTMIKLYGASLLTMFVEGVGQPGVSIVEYPSDAKPRLTNMYNWFGIANRSARIDVGEVTALRALHVFCVLCTYRKPHREPGCMLSEFKKGSAPFNGLGPDVATLLVTIAEKIDTRSDVLLLMYILCCYHAESVRMCVSGNPDDASLPPSIDGHTLSRLLCGVSKIEYTSVASSGIAPICFLSGTVLLLLSRDTSSIPRWFSVFTSAPWYAERYLGSINAGSLVIIVASRTVSRSIAMGNYSLSELHLGFLVNVAPFVHRLHTIAAQRLVMTLRHMVRRLAKAKEAVSQDAHNYSAIATLTSIEAQCATMFDVMLGILDGTRENFALLYDLLHQKAEIFSAIAPWGLGTPLADAAAPLAKLVSYHEAELSSFAENPQHTVEEVMRVIRRVADDVTAPQIVVGALSVNRRDPASPGLASCEAMMFEYEEDENSYEFFAPLVWRLILALSMSVLILPAGTKMSTSPAPLPLLVNGEPSLLP